MDNINQPTQPLPENHETLKVSTSSDPHHFPKMLLIGLGAFLIIVIGIGIGYFLGVNNNQQAIPETTNQIVKISPTPTPDPTANWKTYVNALYSIRYPPSWEYTSGKLGTVFGPSPLITTTDAFDLALLVENEIGSLPSIGGDARSQIKEVKKISIDGTEGGQAVSIDTGTEEESFLQTIVIKNGRTYYFSSDFPKNRQIYDQMLSTFQFSN